MKDHSSKDSKCPSCGGRLLFAPEKQLLCCDFCGNEYSPEKIELLLQIPEIDAGEAGEKEEDKCELVCDSCGAVLIAEKDTSATTCSFCGSPAIIMRRLSKQFRPDYIIPFKVSKEEAESKFAEFARSKKYVPKDYFSRRNLESVKGLYVPFWIMSSRCKVSTRGEGIKKRAVYKDKYSLMSDFDVKYDNVPFDGSLEISDALMEAIEPFDISRRIPFASSYLQGFYAQKFNLTADNLADRILARMGHYGRETAAMSFSGYESINFGACAARPYDLEHMYALYPVWFLNYKYGGQHYMCAVNGQTGKTDGYLPVDEVKRKARLIRHRFVDVLLVLLCIAVFGAFLAALYWLGATFITSSAGFILILILICLASPIGIIVIMAYFNKGSIAAKIEPIAEFFTRPVSKLAARRHKSYFDLCNETNMEVGLRPPAEEYYDSRAKIDFENTELYSNSEL